VAHVGESGSVHGVECDGPFRCASEGLKLLAEVQSLSQIAEMIGDSVVLGDSSSISDSFRQTHSSKQILESWVAA
jgi:hypothetical protein